MKFYIKNKFLSVGGGSSVLDENKSPVFQVKGKVFSPTRVNMSATQRVTSFLRFGTNG